MRLIAETIDEVCPSRSAWDKRILLGCWTVCFRMDTSSARLQMEQAKYLPPCYQNLPGFPITHIGYSISHARQFLKIPNISFNMLQVALMGPGGRSFLRDAKAASRPVMVWTVNSKPMMRWSIRHEMDGVITDDPKKFLDVCDGYDECDGAEQLPLKTYANILWINFLLIFFSVVFTLRHRSRIDMRWAMTNGDGPH